MTRFDELRIRQLDSLLDSAKALRHQPTPRRGWVRTIRAALGMTLRHLALRADVSLNAVANIERTEAKGTVKLESLRRLADAMDCDLVYAIVPRRSLEETVNAQAMKAAERLVGRLADTMALEEQSTSEDERHRLILDLANRLRERPGDIWDA